MNPIFQFPTYLLKRQAIALTGRFRFYDPAGRLGIFSEQKMFRLRADICVSAREKKAREEKSFLSDTTARYPSTSTAPCGLRSARN